MKQVVGDSVKVKAAGGIRDWKTCAAMIDAGAERIGTSSCMIILDEYEKAKVSTKGGRCAAYIRKLEKKICTCDCLMLC